MRATEIFTPNKLPGVTFVDDHLVEKSKILHQSLETGAAVISLSGPSKSGKTVFIEKAIGREHLLQVTGAGVDGPEKLWDRVFDLIGTPVKVTKSSGTSGTETISGKASAGAPGIFGSELGGSKAATDSESQSEEQAVDYLQLLIKELGGTKYVVFVDDFHYIPRDVQVEVSNQIKEAIRGGVNFICASVPYHSDDVLRANADLRGRIFKIDFDYWDAAELKKIAVRGFDALNIDASDATISAFASEAAGSPQLMQSLCLAACFEAGFDQRQDARAALPQGLDLIRKVCVRTAATSDYSSTIEKMKDGPKTRGMDRKPYVLKDQSVRDVYPILLLAIAADPPELTIRYPNLQGRIASLCAKDVPSGSSVTGACAHMSDIANGADNRVVVEWDGENDVLDIRDPYLLFFMRWGMEM